MMKLVNEIDNANAWAVGKFDAIASKAGLPTEIASAMPAISWFSAAGHVNGGISGTFKAEAKDEATAKNLRDVMGGFLAMAKMQAGNKPGMQQLADSLVISGEGNTVALAFSIPSEVLDVLEGLAKGRHPQHAAAATSSRYPRRGRPRLLLRHADGPVQQAGPSAHHSQAHIQRPRHHSRRAVRSRHLSRRHSRRRQQPRVGRGLRDERAARRCWPCSTRSKAIVPNEPDRSLYTRVLADVTLEDGRAREGVDVLLQRAARARAAHHVRRLSRSPERAR